MRRRSFISGSLVAFAGCNSIRSGNGPTNSDSNGEPPIIIKELEYKTDDGKSVRAKLENIGQEEYAVDFYFLVTDGSVSLEYSGVIQSANTDDVVIEAGDTYEDEISFSPRNELPDSPVPLIRLSKAKVRPVNEKDTPFYSSEDIPVHAEYEE